MKKLIVFYLLISLSSGCSSLKGQESGLKEFVQNLIQIYNKKDSNKFNQLIHEKSGLFIMTTIGPTTTWSNVNKVCLEQDCLKIKTAESLGNPYQDFLESYASGDLNLNEIKYTDNAYFECEKIEKSGVFISSKNQYTALSDAVQFFRDNFLHINGPTPDIEKKYEELDQLKIKIRELEKNSRRVVVNSENGTFIFYVTDIDGKWFLTIIDFASTDCSV